MFQGNKADDIGSGVYGNFYRGNDPGLRPARINVGATGSWDDRQVQSLFLLSSLCMLYSKYAKAVINGNTMLGS